MGYRGSSGVYSLGGSISVVELSEKTVKTKNVRVVADRLTVEHILAFAQALVDCDIPPKTIIDGSLNHSTMHFSGLGVTVREELPG